MEPENKPLCVYFTPDPPTLNVGLGDHGVIRYRVTAGMLWNLVRDILAHLHVVNQRDSRKG